MCAQRRAPKCIPTDDDFIRSNIESFGNEIGQTTNWITSMFEIRAGFEKGSREYDALSYRIQCGQLYQQNAIDKAKGIVCKPMPKSWHDRHAANKIEEEDERNFYRSIVADKKPYFMRYIYPALMKQYNTYIKNTTKNSLREFQMTVEELLMLPEHSERQNEFLKYYNYRMPVGMNNCVMNRICRKFEREFDGYISKHNTEHKFDYRFMKNNSEYSYSQYNSIKKLYNDYNQNLRSFAIFTNYERVDEFDSMQNIKTMKENFLKSCTEICPNKAALCNIVLDICYTRNSTKRFAWDMCGDDIIHNLLTKNNNIISFPTLDPNGNIEYCCNNFSVVAKKMEENEWE